MQRQREERRDSSVISLERGTIADAERHYIGISFQSSCDLSGHHWRAGSGRRFSRWV